jgi:hypothetical protein
MTNCGGTVKGYTDTSALKVAVQKPAQFYLSTSKRIWRTFKYQWEAVFIAIIQ